MARALIVYGTTDGQTRKIAERLAEMFRMERWEATVMEARAAGPEVRPAGYDRVIVAASIHIGSYQRAVKRWIRAHLDELSRTHSAFLSVSLGVLEQGAEARREVREIIDRFLHATGWQPTVRKSVAGAVPYTRYSWLKKWIMKRIVAKAGGGTDTTRDYEYTDWEDLHAFAHQFASVPATIHEPVENLHRHESARPMASSVA